MIILQLIYDYNMSKKLKRNSKFGKLNSIYIFTLLIFTILSIICSVYLAKSLNEPVNILADRAKELFNKGPYWDTYNYNGGTVMTKIYAMGNWSEARDAYNAYIKTMDNSILTLLGGAGQYRDAFMAPLVLVGMFWTFAIIVFILHVVTNVKQLKKTNKFPLIMFIISIVLFVIFFILQNAINLEDKALVITAIIFNYVFIVALNMQVALKTVSMKFNK